MRKFWNNLNDFQKIISVSLFFHIIASYFSTGFQHFDEHFQIAEFLNYKIGQISSDQLSWEFREQIRPWFQVFVYHKIYLFFSFFGVSSPFTMMFIFKLLTSLFGVYALVQFFPVIKSWHNDNEKMALRSFALMSLAWYVPYIFSRTSSESLGISLFLIATSLFLRLKDFNKPFLMALFSGLLFGLCYQARFQMAAMVAPLWFWAVFFRKDYKLLAGVALGVLLGIGSGFVFDFWGYGNWNFSLWHYYRTNFIDGRMVHNVEQLPIWWYIRLCFNRGIPPISFVLIVASFIGWWKYRKHPLTWMTLPLFFVHSIVGHKELRYVFPVIILCPLFLGLLLDHYKDKINEFNSKKWFRGLYKTIIGINILFLFISTLRPANPAVNFYKFLWDNQDINKIYVHVESPLTMVGLNVNYYKKPEFEVEVFESLEKIGPLKGKYIFFRKGKDLMEFENRKDCKLLYLTYPRFALNFNIGNWLSRSRVWSLFYCD